MERSTIEGKIINILFDNTTEVEVAAEVARTASSGRFRGGWLDSLLSPVTDKLVPTRRTLGGIATRAEKKLAAVRNTPALEPVRLRVYGPEAQVMADAIVAFTQEMEANPQDIALDMVNDHRLESLRAMSSMLKDPEIY